MMEKSDNRGRWPGLVDRLMELIPARLRRGIAVVPVVRLSGLIGAVTPLRPGMSLAGVARTLERAFAMKNAKAVALVINSPGGSPVQSRQIYLRIRQLAAEKKLPVLVFVEDVAASGGYMIACAGDEIFCDPSSIMGSIGVVGSSFGFQELIKKIGVERRVYTAGERKAMLDPFLPENPDDGARVKSVHRRILGGRNLSVAWPCRCDRRSAFDFACALRGQGTDAGDCAFDGIVVRPSRPQIGGGGDARVTGWVRGSAGRGDFGAGVPGHLGQIRVLNANLLAPFGPQGCNCGRGQVEPQSGT